MLIHTAEMKLLMEVRNNNVGTIFQFTPRFFERFSFSNSNSGGGVQLGPLGTAATNTPIVPTPDDYDDGEIGGMMVGRRNRST
jgi:hypothetical protein